MIADIGGVAPLPGTDSMQNSMGIVADRIDTPPRIDV
jgi:hypothetical protein